MEPMYILNDLFVDSSYRNIGVGGSLNVTTAGGDVVNFVGIGAGTFLPVQVIRVNSVVTATDIIALW